MMKTTFGKEKYRVFTDQNQRKIIAVSTYAGKNVKGYAKADPRDTFDTEKGTELAIARCNAKIAEKRAKRAASKVSEAVQELAVAQKHLRKMQEYLVDANEACDVAKANVAAIEKTL